MGAFGLNASILDAANLAWKLGLAAKGEAQLKTILKTYGDERRDHAVRIIEVSGTYLRFICGSSLSLPNLRNTAALDQQDKLAKDTANTNGAVTNGEPVSNGTIVPVVNGKNQSNGMNGKDQSNGVNGENQTNGVNNTAQVDSQKKDLEFLANFFNSHGQFLLGVDCPYSESVLAPAESAQQTSRAIAVKNGVRAPNPRVCFSATKTGYLYDKFVGPPRFHLVLFVSSLAGQEIRKQLTYFLSAIADPKGFYHRFGGSDRFNIVVVAKVLPFEWENGTTEGQSIAEIQAALPKEATVVFDDRAPDEDAHTTWGVDHHTGGVAVVRPDLWVSITSRLDDTESLSKFFDGFLL